MRLSIAEHRAFIEATSALEKWHTQDSDQLDKQLILKLDNELLQLLERGEDWPVWAQDVVTLCEILRRDDHNRGARQCARGVLRHLADNLNKLTMQKETVPPIISRWVRLGIGRARAIP